MFETPLDDFEQVMGVNVRGSFLVVREASRQMRPRRAGAIVLLSSLDGLQAEHGMFSYCTSKGALLNLARAAALDLARDQVRSIASARASRSRRSSRGGWRHSPMATRFSAPTPSATRSVEC